MSENFSLKERQISNSLRLHSLSSEVPSLCTAGICRQFGKSPNIQDCEFSVVTYNTYCLEYSINYPSRKRRLIQIASAWPREPAAAVERFHIGLHRIYSLQVHKCVLIYFIFSLFFRTTDCIIRLFYSSLYSSASGKLPL